MEYAEWSFDLSKVNQSATKRDHLTQIYKSTGVMPEELKPRKFPEPLYYVWKSFMELTNARQSGFSGPSPLTYTDIKAWSDLTGNELSPVDLEIIKRLDALYLKVMNG